MYSKMLRAVRKSRIGAMLTACCLLAALLVVTPIGATAPANASASSVTATCEALSVNLQNYQPIKAAVPAVEAVEGHPSVPPTYQEVVVTPAIPAIPATYVQEWKYVQKQTKKIKWMPFGWNGIVDGTDHGKGWAYAQPRESRDTTTILTPAVPAIPAVTDQKEIDPGQPYIAPISGVDAVPAQVNTVIVTIDNVEVAHESFGVSFSQRFSFANSTIGHTYRVQVTAWDNAKYNLDTSGASTPCEQPVTSTIVVPVAPTIHVAQRCGLFGSVDLAANEGVVYALDSFAKETTGDFTVTATPANEAYRFEGLQTVTFTGTVGQYVECSPEVVMIDVVPSLDAPGSPTCEAGGFLPSLPVVKGLVYAWDRPFDGPGTYIATATAQDGFLINPDIVVDSVVEIEDQLSGEDCVVVEPGVDVIDAHPDEPYFMCGYVWLGDDTDDYYYEVTANEYDGGLYVTVTAISRDDRPFADNITTSWGHIFDLGVDPNDDPDCQEEPPVVDPIEPIDPVDPPEDGVTSPKPVVVPSKDDTTPRKPIAVPVINADKQPRQPAVIKPVAQVTTASPQKQLADTGPSDVVIAVLGAIILISAGTILVLRRRRRA